MTTATAMQDNNYVQKHSNSLTLLYNEDTFCHLPVETDVNNLHHALHNLNLVLHTPSHAHLMTSENTETRLQGRAHCSPHTYTPCDLGHLK